MDLDALASYCSALWQTRETAAARLDEIASYVAPDRRGFGAEMPESDEGRAEIWDSAPEDAALLLASALHGMLTNPASDWLSLAILGEEDQAATEFAEMTTGKMLEVFSDPASCFNNEVNAFYLDLVTLGWAVFFLFYKDGMGPRFLCVPPSQCAIAENADGLVDAVLRRWTMTAAQLAGKFGADKISDKARLALDKGSAEAFGVSHLVCPLEKLPKELRDGGELQGPFVSVHFETEAKNLLRLSRYEELPYMVPRWSKRSGEIYGRGPGHACLPDMRVLNRVGKSQLIGAEKLADPPVVALSDSVVGKIRTHAGGVTTVDPTQCPGGDPQKALGQLAVQYRLEVAEAIMEKRREAIRSAFLNDRIQLAGGERMTATEAVIRKNRQDLILGPVSGRLESEFLGPLVGRLFLMLLRQNWLQAPPELSGRELRAKYLSPIARAQRQGEAEAFLRAQEYLAPAAQIDPSILENFDFNRVARDSQALFGFSKRYLLSEEEVMRRREARQQAEAYAQATAGQARDGEGII